MPYPNSSASSLYTLTDILRARFLIAQGDLVALFPALAFLEDEEGLLALCKVELWESPSS
jgi:hypothetical protein